MFRDGGVYEDAYMVTNAVLKGLQVSQEYRVQDSQSRIIEENTFSKIFV